MKPRKRIRRILGKIAFGFLVALTTVTTTLALLASCLLVADWRTEDFARVLPSYARADLTETLAKETWTDEDYEFLYLQTGLGRAPLNALRKTPTIILDFQNALFYEGEIDHIEAAPTTPHEIFVDYVAPLAPLEDGDVLVTSTCHTYGWRNGHAAIVSDAKNERILQSVAPGYPSHVENATWFRTSTNFIVLRLKDVSADERSQIGRAAEKTLSGIPYSLTVGIFSPKDQGTAPKATHCSHLVWQAYKNFGYDVDSDGGLIVTANDIARSPLFEVVQVFGFDPVKLW